MSNLYQDNAGTVQFYRTFLTKCVTPNESYASSESVNQADALAAVATFDRLSKFGAAMALEVALGSINMKAVLSGAAGYIARELEKLPKDKTVEGNSIRRLREIYKKLNSDIKKCQITIGGVDYSKEAIEQATVKLAPALQDKWLYSLTTTTGSIQEKLILEVVGVK